MDDGATPAPGIGTAPGAVADEGIMLWTAVLQAAPALFASCLFAIVDRNCSQLLLTELVKSLHDVHHCLIAINLQPYQP